MSDQSPLAIILSFAGLELANVLVLETENRLIVFLGRRSVFQEQHRVPLLDRASCQHLVDCQRDRLLPLCLCTCDRDLDGFGVPEALFYTQTRNIEDLIAGKVFKFLGVVDKKCFHCVT